MEIKDYTIGADGVKVRFEGGEERFIEKAELSGLFITYGGSFVKKIGGLLNSADSYNCIKVMTCWEGYVVDFIEKFYTLKK